MNLTNLQAWRVCAFSLCVVIVLWLNVLSPVGFAGRSREYRRTCEETRRRRLVPCVVCGKPGTMRDYRSTGIGLPNVTEYKGPYVYCDRHTSTQPQDPFQMRGVAMPLGFTLFAIFGLFVLFFACRTLNDTITMLFGALFFEALAIGSVFLSLK
jgi:hypothetical protein